MYDHGSPEANLNAYGKSTPPKYDLAKVTAPVAIFWGANDMLCRPEVKRPTGVNELYFMKN